MCESINAIKSLTYRSEDEGAADFGGVRIACRILLAAIPCTQQLDAPMRAWGFASLKNSAFIVKTIGVRWTTRDEVVASLFGYVEAGGASDARANLITLIGRLCGDNHGKRCAALALDPRLSSDERAALVEKLARLGQRLDEAESRQLFALGVFRPLSALDHVVDAVVAAEVIPEWLDALDTEARFPVFAACAEAPAGTFAAKAFDVIIKRGLHGFLVGDGAASQWRCGWRTPVCFERWMACPDELQAYGVEAALRDDPARFLKSIARYPARERELSKRFLLPPRELVRLHGGARELLTALSLAVDAESEACAHEARVREERAQHFAWICARHDRGEPVVGVVGPRVKGGRAVTVGPLRCFLPGSQIALSTHTAAEPEGLELPMRILKVAVERGTVVVSLRDVPHGPAQTHPATSTTAPPPAPAVRDTRGLFATLAQWDGARALLRRALQGESLLAEKMYRAWREHDAGAAVAWSMRQPERTLPNIARADRIDASASDDQIRRALAWSQPSIVRDAALRALIGRVDAVAVFEEELRSIALKPTADDLDVRALGILAGAGDTGACRTLLDIIHGRERIERSEKAYLRLFDDNPNLPDRRDALLRVLDHCVVGPWAARDLVILGRQQDLDAVLQRALSSPSYARAFA